MDASPPLYNSRVIQIYIDYLSLTYPDINTDEILAHAGITHDEIEDSAHWFTQQQADRFYEIVVQKTGDTQIARNAGRFSASSKGLSILQQYVVGLLNTEAALLSMAKIYPFLTRHATISAKKLGPGKIEIVSILRPGMEEKPYQCENRIGSMEALPKLFTNHYARIDHPECLHREGKVCRYTIAWDSPPSFRLRLVRNYSLIVSVFLAVLFFFILPNNLFITLGLLLAGVNAVLSLFYGRLKIRELEKIIEKSHYTAEERIKLADTRYNNSLLTQEIGQATAAILNIEELMQKLAALMDHRLEFDRGLIMLANESGTHLVFSAGYGYSDTEKNHLQKTAFNLTNPNSQGFFVRCFLDQKHVIVSNMDEVTGILSERSQDLVRDFSVRSLLCVPIIYKSKSLGILAVDNIRTKTPLKKSDINLLEGIAFQIAISINNAKSFQQLQENENKYRQTIESISEGFYEITLDRRIRFGNKALSTILGRDHAELVDSYFDSFFQLGQEFQLEGLFHSILESRQPVSFSQFEVVGVDGTPIPVDLSASLIIDSFGQPDGFRGILRDATERLRLENRRIQLENQLLRAQKMESIGTLAGGIAHNFNNWLAGILGNITLIRMDAAHQEKIVQRAVRIEHIIENAAKMTQQLLGYARAGSYEVKTTNLNTILQESVDTFAATKKEVSIFLDLHPALLSVKVDKSQIEQVFWNLYVNAIDAMPNGGRLMIRTDNTTAEELRDKPYTVVPGDYVVIEFTDTGTGIDSEHLQNIFEPFFTTKGGRGTGLGLASVFGIIKSHHGYIDVFSKKQVGSTFKLYLPAAKESPNAQESIESTLREGHGTILIVDDEAPVLDTSQQLLERLGYTVLTAAGGQEALEKFGELLDNIDLVMVDMIMPEMSGRELISRIKAIRPAIKTLLCSGYSMNEIAKEIIDQGCNGFIQKPFKLNHISGVIKEILKQDHSLNTR